MTLNKLPYRIKVMAESKESKCVFCGSGFSCYDSVGYAKIKLGRCNRFAFFHKSCYKVAQFVVD